LAARVEAAELQLSKLSEQIATAMEKVSQQSYRSRSIMITII
jgi:hypothetical protein